MSSPQSTQRASTGSIVWTIARRLSLVVVLMLAFILSATVTIYIIFRGGDTRLPNVVGKTEVDAKGVLSQQNFEIRVQRRSDDKIPANTVIETRPAPDSSVKKNSIVTIVISSGPVQTKSAVDLPEEFHATLARQFLSTEATETR